ncbi:MAG: dihydropteroate synthase [Zetaproteobacteria bacterium]|nr:MAG: dihydropteroate synthase [Zetaproteobacteria bacterium]
MNDWFRKNGQPAWIMGVLNCTPDSFSDGGLHADMDQAIEHGMAMWRDGADWIDVGGESTRPGAPSVALEEELERVLGVVQHLCERGCRVSIDTMKAEVMDQAVKAGAGMINDVSALRFDPASLDVAAGCQALVCLMHMQGTPRTMQQCPRYEDPVDDVCAFLEQRMDVCVKAGIGEERILVDPGIGFGKDLEHNLALVAGVRVIRNRLGRPVLLGVSRKSFLGRLTGASVEDRELETAVAGGIGVFLGADGLRVHDVRLQRRASIVAAALADAALV